MKKILLLLSFLLMISCEGSSVDRNPYLQDASFAFDINLNLPLYSSLKTPGNAIFIGNSGVGLKGILVFNTGFGNFMAWEASCPNHTPSSCSTMTIKGTVCECSCENYQYSLANGFMINQPENSSRVYGLLNYRVTASGDNLKVYN